MELSGRTLKSFLVSHSRTGLLVTCLLSTGCDVRVDSEHLSAMTTPEKKNHGRKEHLTPDKISLGKTPPRSPAFPDLIADFTAPLPLRYAAGVLPLSYVMDESTKKMKWMILLLIEFRSKEKRKCLHPLAGKKEDIDEHYPMRTALREFGEETYGVFSSFDVQEQIASNTRDHSLVYVSKESKMIFFFTYIPYREDIQEEYLKAKGDNQQGDALIWYDLEEYLKRRGRISYDFKGEAVQASECAHMWFTQQGMLDGFTKMRAVTLKRLLATNSPLAPVLSDSSASSIDDLAASLGATQLNASSTPQTHHQASSSSSTSSSAPTPSTSQSGSS